MCAPCRRSSRRGTNADTPLESCKLAATLVNILCAQIDAGTEELVAAAGWLSRSAGAFKSAHSERSNQRAHVLSKAAEKATQQCAQWAQGGDFTRAVAVAASLSDLTVFTQPWKGGFAHSFVLVLTPVAATWTAAATYQARLYMAFGPPIVGYSIREQVFHGAGSKVMSQGDVEAWVARYAAMENCSTWAQGKKLYAQLFAATPEGLGGSYKFVSHTRIRTATVSRASVTQRPLSASH